MIQSSKNINYAGFFSRLIAFIIDILILIMPISAISYWYGTESLFGKVLVFLLWWIYTSFSISRYKATLGNKIVSLQVLQKNMMPLSFRQASLRYLYFFIYFVSVLSIINLLEFVAYEYGDIVYLSILLLLIPALMMLFNSQRQTLYDYLAKSVVIDKMDVTLYQEKGKEPVYEKRVSVPSKILRIIGTIVILAFTAYFVFFMSVMYMAYGGRGDTSNKPITSVSKTIDYNNSKIDFYKKELEIASVEFIEAGNMYDILHGDVKKDLALNCIRFFLKKEGNEDWLDEGSAYRNNARNRYANSVERVKKAKQNERYMGHHFYDYDLNEVNHIEDKIADMWDINANKDTCEKTLSAEKMYGMFIMKYIQNRQEQKKSYLNDLKNEKDRKWQRFYKKELEQITSWLKVLNNKHPEYLDYMQKEREATLVRENQIKNSRILKKQKKLWKGAEMGRVYGLNYFNGFNANIRNEIGQTPLMIAAQNGHNHYIDLLKGAIVDVWIKDEKGQTAFDYIKIPTNSREKMFTDRTYGTLRLLEVEQIFRGKAKIIQSGYSNSTDILKVFISGANCQDFELPKNTPCKSKQ